MVCASIIEERVIWAVVGLVIFCKVIVGSAVVNEAIIGAAVVSEAVLGASVVGESVVGSEVVRKPWSIQRLSGIPLLVQQLLRRMLMM